MEIPREKLRIRFSRSGGPGGQNVNKVATKVDVRFVVDDAEWIADDVKARLASRQRTRINAAGELVVTSSRHRTQGQNLKDCLDKLAAMLVAAERAPRRRVPTRASRGAGERRLARKKRAGETKRQRRWRPEAD